MEDCMKLTSVDRTILVQSSNIDLGEVLPEHARASILQVAGKYFGRLNMASVHFTREGITYRCTVNMQMGGLRMMSGEALHKDIYAAFKIALEKVAKQLRRAKRELREDKAERIDKSMVLRESERPPSKSRRRDDDGAKAQEPEHSLDRDDFPIPMKMGRDSFYRLAAE
jgi:ribosomal subunit interface protein